MVNMSRLNVRTTELALKDLDSFNYYTHKGTGVIALSGGMKNLDDTGSIMMGNFSADASLKIEQNNLAWILKGSWQNQFIGTEMPIDSSGSSPTGNYMENGLGLKTWLDWKLGENFLKISPIFGFNYYFNNDSDPFSAQALKKKDINFDLGLMTSIWRFQLGYQANNFGNVDLADPERKDDYTSHNIYLGYKHDDLLTVAGLVKVVPQDKNETDFGLYARWEASPHVSFFGCYQMLNSRLNLGIDWRPTEWFSVPIRADMPLPGSRTWETGVNWSASLNFYIGAKPFQGKAPTVKKDGSVVPEQQKKKPDVDSSTSDIPVDIQF